MPAKRRFWLIILMVCFLTIGSRIEGSGRMLEPPSRSTLWRFKTTDPILVPFQNIIKPNYNDMNLNCGGRKVLMENEGKCGICGDPYNAAQKENESGGKYALGIITRQYQLEQTIEIRIETTAARAGYFEFRLCSSDNLKRKIDQKCFDKNQLRFANGSMKWRLPSDPKSATKIHQLQVKLPDDVTCAKCVLQWRYRAGNSWGSENGKEGIGMGQQDEFYGCADVSIVPINHTNSNASPSSPTSEVIDVTNETANASLKSFLSYTTSISPKSLIMQENRILSKIHSQIMSSQNTLHQLPQIADRLSARSKANSMLSEKVLTHLPLLIFLCLRI